MELIIYLKSWLLFCMFNQHALAQKKKNGGWRNIFSSSFKGSKGSFNSGTEANVKSIFENPLTYWEERMNCRWILI